MAYLFSSIVMLAIAAFLGKSLKDEFEKGNLSAVTIGGEVYVALWVAFLLGLFSAK